MRRTPAILAPLLLCLAFPLFAQQGAGKQQAYWVFDHVVIQNYICILANKIALK